MSRLCASLLRALLQPSNLMTDFTDGVTLWDCFHQATLWAKDKPFYKDAANSPLPLRWMSLGADIIGLQSALVGDRSQFNIYIELASRYDIEVVRPYLVAGVLDIAAIDHAVANNIDPELVRSLLE